jgi:hypothetical protein
LQLEHGSSLLLEAPREAYCNGARAAKRCAGAASVANRQPGPYKDKIRLATDFDQTPHEAIRAFEDG